MSYSVIVVDDSANWVLIDHLPESVVESANLIDLAHGTVIDFVYEKSRNRKVFEGIEQEGRILVQLAQQEWMELLQCKDILQVGFNYKSRAVNREDKLVPPKPAWGSMNRNINSKSLLEAEALRSALKAAKDKGWRRVEIQAGCFHILNKIVNKRIQNKDVEAILEEILYCSSWFYECTFSFLSKNGSCMSHLIAKVVIESDRTRLWEKIFPLWLRNLAQAEIGQLSS
ncbi:hypothetical protein ACH5RR_012145 [Cinchona calisaya]|uniref:RNase H type-1 domain-containing protein n=1 Tax=Cinchona calisaya TaxID=153742 RepID=A0ABD3A6X6_9GENT